MRAQKKLVWPTLGLVLGLIVLGVILGRQAVAHSASGGTGVRLVYSAKFLCGNLAGGRADFSPHFDEFTAGGFEPRVNPGNYTTDVNIHNPQAKSVSLSKKAVLSGWEYVHIESGPEQKFLPGPQVMVTLEPDSAFELDCPEIVRLLGTTYPPPIRGMLAPFIKGFVVITTAQELDVVGVYTGERATDTAMTMDVEYITAKRIEVPGAELPTPTTTPPCCNTGPTVTPTATPPN